MNSLFEKMGIKAELETDENRNQPVAEQEVTETVEAKPAKVEPEVEPKVEEVKEAKAEKPTETKAEPEEEFITVTIGDEIELPSDDLIQMLRNHGIEVESLDDLKQQKPLNEELMAIQKFMAATGKPAKDYYEIFKDYDSMDEDKLLRAYHKELGTTPKLMELKLEEMTILPQDEDYDDDDITKHNRKAEALREAELISAKSHFKSQQEQFALPPQPTEQELLKQRESQILATKQMAERVSTNLPNIEFSVGQKKFKMVHGKQSRELVKDFIENPTKHFVEPFVDAQGQFKSPSLETKYYENGLWFNESSREQMLAVRDKQIWDAAIEAQSKEKRNVTLDSVKSASPSKKSTSFDAWKSVRQER